MPNPWLLVIVAIAAILVVVRLAAVLMGVVADRAIGSHHRAAEIIVNTGKVPPAWIKSTLPQPASPDQESQAKAAAIAKLDALIIRFTTSPLVADEETRQVLLGELRRAREHWQKSAWREIV